MVIQPDKQPDKIPPPKEQERPSYQKPPSRDFGKEIQWQKDRYPPDKEVISELRRRAQSLPPPPPKAQPRQQVQQESSSTPGFGNALESGLDSMERQQQQPADQKSSNDQPPVKDKPPQKEAPPKKEQKQPVKGQQQPQQQQVQAPQTGAAQAGVHVAAEVAGAGTGTNIDQIINVFQSNPVFQSHVQTLSVQARGADTEIAVMMANGVNVNVTVMAGGKDINVVIRGITAEAQAAIDNPANQALLQARLGEKGFTVHQMRTFRDEEPSRPTGETAKGERGEGTGGQGGPGDEETT